MITINKYLCIIGMVTVFLLPAFAIAQDNGQNLRFQGISEVPDFNVKASAMGNAVSAISGELGALYYNPAGLVGLKGIQVSVSYNSTSKEMWEYQYWWSGNDYTLPPRWFMGMIPLPTREQSGWWSYDVYPIDSLPNYDVKMGTDKFDKVNADWIHEADDTGLKSITAAVPLKVAGSKSMVIAASYSRNRIDDYDQNDVFLDPHPGRLPYAYWNSTDSDRETHWSNYKRQRAGAMNQMSVALAIEISKRIQLGVGLHLLSGKTDDMLSTEKVGMVYMDLNENEYFKFFYEDGSFTQSGTSKFSKTQMDFGAQFHLNRMNIGLKYRTNTDLKRTWEYTNVTTDSLEASVTEETSGEDRIQTIPGTVTLGVCFYPTDRVKFTFDWETTPYSKASHEYDETLVGPDTTVAYNWVNQSILRAGFEFKLLKSVKVLGGYQFAPKTWAPYRAAFDKKGQPTHIYSVGLSVDVPLGVIDVAYQISRFKYYDAYMIVQPFNVINSNQIMFGYTLTL